MDRSNNLKTISVQSGKTTNGFTLLELVVVIILISILGLVALNRMGGWQVEAERAMINTVQGNIRSALGLETAQLALHGQFDQLPNLSGSNPINLIAQPPGDYIGVFTDSDPKTQQPGIWYFNPNQKALIYTLRYSEGFSSSLSGGIPRVRFKIKLIYSDKNQNQRFDPASDAIAGLDFVSLDKYQWLSPAK